MSNLEKTIQERFHDKLTGQYSKGPALLTKKRRGAKAQVGNVPRQCKTKYDWGLMREKRGKTKKNRKRRKEREKKRRKRPSLGEKREGQGPDKRKVRKLKQGYAMSLGGQGGPS